MEERAENTKTIGQLMFYLVHKVWEVVDMSPILELAVLGCQWTCRSDGKYTRELEIFTKYMVSFTLSLYWRQRV